MSCGSISPSSLGSEFPRSATLEYQKTHKKQMTFVIVSAVLRIEGIWLYLLCLPS